MTVSISTRILEMESKQGESMMDRDRLLNDLLPHRMQAVATLNLALKLYATYGVAPMNLYAATSW